MSNTRQLHVPIEKLLAQTDCLRRLAHGLVYEHHADDVMQQTWLRALQHPPAHDANIPGWFATVAKSVAARMRQQLARAGRDSTLEPEATLATSTDELVERIELHTLVNEIMLNLPNTVRDVMLLHYFEDLKPSQIAQQLEISTATVRHRLQQGLDSMRTALERKYAAGERHWCAGFALLLTQPAGGDVPATAAADGSPSLRSNAAQRAVAAASLIAVAALVATLFATRGHPSQPSSTQYVARNEPVPAPTPEKRDVVLPAPGVAEHRDADSAAARNVVTHGDTPSLASLFRGLLENGRKPEFQDFPWNDVEQLVERASSALMSDDSEPFGNTAWNVTLPSDDLSLTLTRSGDATLGPTLTLQVDATATMTFDSRFTAKGTRLTLVAQQAEGNTRVELTLETAPGPTGVRNDSPESLQTGATLALSPGPVLTVSPTTHSAAGRSLLFKRTAEPAATSASTETGAHIWQSLAQVFEQPEREDRPAVPGLAEACDAFFDAMATAEIAPTIAVQLIDSLSELKSQHHIRPYSMMGVDFQQIATGTDDPIVLFRQRKSDGLETVEVVLQRLAFPTKSGAATAEIVLGPGYQRPLDLTISVEVDHQPCYRLGFDNQGSFEVVRTRRLLNGTLPTESVQRHHLPADFEPASKLVERLEGIFAND